MVPAVNTAKFRQQQATPPQELLRTALDEQRRFLREVPPLCGEDVAGEVEHKSVLGAALIAAAQAVERYEMTRHGTLVTSKPINARYARYIDVALQPSREHIEPRARSTCGLLCGPPQRPLQPPIAGRWPDVRRRAGLSTHCRARPEGQYRASGHVNRAYRGRTLIPLPNVSGLAEQIVAKHVVELGGNQSHFIASEAAVTR